MSTESILDNLPNKISAGASSIIKNKKTVLAFPTGRGEGRSNTLLSSSNYQNGLSFDCYTRSDGTYGNMSTFRTKIKSNLGSSVISQTLNSLANTKNTSNNMEHIVSISMPMSKTYSNKLSHNFNTGKMSNVERSGGTLKGMISSIASDTIAGIVDKAGGNYLADNDEALASVVRNTYAGVNNREMTYTWDLEARNMNDLVAILNIYNTFAYRSLGTISKNSKTLKNIGEQIKGASQTAQDKILGSLSQNQVVVPATVDFVSNAMTVTNPDIWTIQKYATNTALGSNDVFGPAQIKDIDFNEVPGEVFQGLKQAPNHSGKYTLTITFIESITLDRSNW